MSTGGGLAATRGRVPGRVGRLGELAAAAQIPHAAIAAVIYLAAATLFRFQAVEHLNSVCACDGGADATQFVWALQWWPYALLHGLNPVVTHMIYAPGGMNLASGTSIPGAALLMAPVTELAGPVVAYNLLSLVAPVSGAWAAYRLCQYVTRSPAASILGGYLYGFSSYELGQLPGHLHTAFTFAAPLAALLTLRRLDDRIGSRRYALLLALTLTAQLLLSSELELTLVCLGVAALVCGWLVSPAQRRRQIVGLAIPLLAALGLTALVCSPYLYYEIAHGNAYSAGWDTTYYADLLNYVIPTRITWIGGHALAGVSGAFSGGDLLESTAYLGVIQVVLVGAYIVGSWRTRTARFLLSLLTLVVVWSLGSFLVIDGQRTITLPWWLYRQLPLLDQMLPVRLTMYVALLCAVAVAGWVAGPGRGRTWRWAPALAAAALLLPAGGALYPGSTRSVYHARFRQPSFLTAGLYRHFLHRGEIVLPIPTGESGESLLWQAETGMYFRLASGYFGAPPAAYARQSVFWQLQQTAGSLTPGAGRAVRAFLLREHVGAIVLDPQASALWEPALAGDGLRAIRVGGILLYRIPPFLAI